MPLVEALPDWDNAEAADGRLQIMDGSSLILAVGAASLVLSYR